jgi:hypothetical protein
MWIEIMKSGEHTDSSGANRSFPIEELEMMAALYNEKAGTNASFEAPIVKGHPAHDEPAWGWVKRLARRGEYLLAELKGVMPEFMDEVRKGMYKKISIAIYPDGMLKHIGFLGAAAPAVQGMKPVGFRNEGNGSIYTFSISEVKDIPEGAENDTESLRERVSKLEAMLGEFTVKARNAEKAVRNAMNRRFVENLGSDGNFVSPADTEMLCELLEFAHELDQSATESQNGGSYTSRIRKFAESLVRPGLGIEYKMNAPTDRRSSFDGRNVQPGRMTLHEKAIGICNQNPEMSYENALNQALEL